MLSLTQQLLEKNCDIYTFWNIRRIAIELRITENQKIQANPEISDEEKSKNSQKIENLLAGELFLSYECIKVSFINVYQLSIHFRATQSPIQPGTNVRGSCNDRRRRITRKSWDCAKKHFKWIAGLWK